MKKIKYITLRIVMFEQNYKGVLTFIDANHTLLYTLLLTPQQVKNWRTWLYVHCDHVTNDYNMISDILVMQFTRKEKQHMSYSKYKTVIMIDKSATLTRPGRPWYRVQFSHYETLRDKPHNKALYANENSVKRLIAWAKRDGFDFDERYALYGHWYAVKYYKDTIRS